MLPGICVGSKDSVPANNLPGQKEQSGNKDRSQYCAESCELESSPLSGGLPNTPGTGRAARVEGLRVIGKPHAGVGAWGRHLGLPVAHSW